MSADPIKQHLEQRAKLKIGSADKPQTISAAALRLKTFAPVRWVVPDIIPDGLTILAGKPKGGKSWLVLATALAIARGGATLGKMTAKGTVLYAALEDGERRLKSRLEKVATGGEWPARLEFWTTMERLENGGLEQLRQWIAEADDPRAIFIDTFAKVRSPKGKDESPYESDYRAAGALKALADETGVAIVLVHHVRKMEADDPMDAVSGTTGLTGAVDTILVLKRGVDGVTLFGRGRDIEELELAIQFERDVCRWRVLGEAADVRRSAARNAVLEALRADGEMTPLQIADVTGKPRAAIRVLLGKMARDGEVRRLGKGKYGPL
jgi:hypothetical protein